MQKQLFKTRVNIALQDREFIIAVFGKTFYFFAFNRQRTLILINAMAIEHAHFHDRARRTWRQLGLRNEKAQSEVESLKKL